MSEPATAFTLPEDSTPIAEAAEMYVAAGLTPIPLYGLMADGSCQCGGDCPTRTRGKHPIGGQWQKRATLDLDEVRDRFRGHRGNIGIYLGLTGLVLIDADGETGLATAETWQLPETLTAQSGSGVGAHFVYRFASNQEPAAVTDRSKFAPGLDVKARGQFVAAPSRHASGGVYRWTRIMPPAILPDWLYDRLKKPVYAPPEPPSGTIESAGNLEKRARAYMAKVPPGISGSDGHTQTFAAARVLASFVQKGLAESIALSLLVEYNATCQPRWSEKELAHKWDDAKKAHTLPRLEDRPRPHGAAPPRLRAIAGGRSGAPAPSTHTGDDDASGPPSEPPSGSPPGGGSTGDAEWRDKLLYKYGRSGQRVLITHTDNLVRILQLDPKWAGKIAFDAFRHRITTAPDLPWDEFNKPTTHLGYWTDEDAVRMSGWMRREWQAYAFDPSRTECDNAAAIVSRTHDFNPVRDYLESVAWDGTPRLSHWLSNYLGAEDNEYHRLVGAWWLISAVARIFDPGCKVDTVPILEGPQGLKKSSALKVLAGPEFFNDTPIDIGSKDAYTAIQGCWFVELAELESLMKATASKAKAFFSSSKDRFRRAYARHEKDEYRQCIFVGTVNLKQYLNDPTGARRFWPIQCTRIDIEALERDRDQLWAEAVEEYDGGRVWYPTANTEHALLTEPQEERTHEDAWEAQVASWLARLTTGTVTSVEVLRDALNLEARDWTTSAQTRVGIILSSKLKWAKRRAEKDGKRVWVYERPS